jgi:MFS family permease
MLFTLGMVSFAISPYTTLMPAMAVRIFGQGSELVGLFIGAVGACAGTSYVTGFTLLQENSSDEIRGRTFATLYTVIRLCLLISLTISPLWADCWDWVTNQLFTDQTIVIGSISYVIPGWRVVGWWAHRTRGHCALRSVRRARRVPAVSSQRPCRHAIT